MMRVANEVDVSVQVLQKSPCCCWLLLLDVHVVVVVIILLVESSHFHQQLALCDKM